MPKNVTPGAYPVLGAVPFGGAPIPRQGKSNVRTTYPQAAAAHRAAIAAAQIERRRVRGA